ncbi:MAG: serine hydrolase [Rhodospirillales bacterium]|nr:serine hydrolase [Rhodospirillales bacterium]
MSAQPAAAKYASIVLDAKTGRIIHEINADTRNYPASLTKMMTLYLIFDALESKIWKLNNRLRISARAARQPSSKLGLNRGEYITVKEAIMALVTKSANDVATVVAENLSGSERGFALKMTAMARKLGMNRTTFRNASGLPHRGQMSTARDMGVLARALIRDFPLQYRYFSTDSFLFDGITHSNHNKLLDTYDGADGIKTGYIRASGFNLVASAYRNGRRVIGVIFGGNSPRSRNALMTRLLDLGFKALNQESPPVIASLEAEPPYAKITAKPTSRGATPKPPAIARANSKNPIPANRRWGVQVGAYARYSQAYEAARRAIEIAPSFLMEGDIKIVPLRKNRGRVLHRARIKGISKEQASQACDFLRKRNTNCMEIKMRDDYRVAANER